MPSLGGGMLEMDDMMKKMMSGMKLGGNGGSLLGMDSGSSVMRGSSKMSSFSSSSMTSSSSTSMSSSSKTLGGFGGMPQLADMGFPKFDIEELSTAGQTLPLEVIPMKALLLSTEGQTLNPRGYTYKTTECWK